jgi:hypothetical protein
VAGDSKVECVCTLELYVYNVIYKMRPGVRHHWILFKSLGDHIPIVTLLACVSHLPEVSSPEVDKQATCNLGRRGFR